jgi:hypothetical protein
MIKQRWIIALLAAALFVALFVAITGCGRKASPQETKEYDNDGYLGMTNTNPNLHINPTYHNYEVDTNMMRGALNLVQGVQGSRITTNGSRATVTVFVPEGTSVEEEARIQQQSVQMLQKHVPRYTYVVKIKRR